MNKSIRHILSLSFIITVAAAYAQSSAPLQMEAFAQHTRIDLNGSGPFYQSAIPIEVYQSIQQTDLSDLRVFNGEGEVVPYTVIAPESSRLSQTQEISVPIFPIKYSEEKSHDLSLEIQRNRDDTLIALKESPSPQTTNTNAEQGIVLDVSQIHDTMEGLRLEVGPTSLPFHSYTLETSDDLLQWHLINNHAQFVRLEHAGQRIEKNTVEWNLPTEKYLRLLWIDPEHAPQILSAHIRTSHTALHRPSLIWSKAITPFFHQKNIYDYALPGHIPLEQIRINVFQNNTLVPIELQKKIYLSFSRHHSQESWVTLTHAVIYRLQSPNQETATSPDIALNAPSEQQLRLLVDDRSGGFGSTSPTLQIGFTPQTLVFLARGKEPFTLAWGAMLPSAALPIETLMPNYSSDQPMEASPAHLQPIKLSLHSSAASKSDSLFANEQTHKAILWAILVLGVLVLGRMASSLIKQTKQQNKKD